MPKTVSDLIHEEVKKFIDELAEAGFTTHQINVLYRAMHRVVIIAAMNDMDHRLIEGDDEREINGY